jgi:hypothetical protein
MVKSIAVAAAALAVLLALILLVDGPAPASGPPPEPFAFPPPGVTAIGSAAADLPRDTPRRQAAISRAVAAATNRATPRALRAAKQRAQRIAAASGLRLGAIYGVAPETSGSYAWSTETGTFGPGRYCGRVSHFSYRTTATGRRVRHVRSTRGCRAPSQVTVSLSVTYTRR